MTPKQQAEQMARKCGKKLYNNALAIASSEDSIKARADVILSEIPLEEFFELARAAASDGCHHSLEINALNCPICRTLTNLRNKGIEI